MEFKKHNDYSIIMKFDAEVIRQQTDKFVKLTFVDNVYKAVKWLEEKNGSNWHHVNVYARRTGRFLLQLKKGDYIPQKPN